MTSVHEAAVRLCAGQVTIVSLAALLVIRIFIVVALRTAVGVAGDACTYTNGRLHACTNAGKKKSVGGWSSREGKRG